MTSAPNSLNSECANCKKPLSTKSKVCCSVKCKHELSRSVRIKQWLDNPETANSALGTKRWLRAYLIEQANYKCSLCSWGEVNQFTNTIPLELDHIDGNHMNSHPDNLRIICPNCHSLTENYKALNRNKNQKSRYRYYRDKGWW